MSLVKVYSRETQCDGKIPYPTEEAASVAMGATPNYEARALNYYECPHCSFWHVGHIPWPDTDEEQRISESHNSKRRGDRFVPPQNIQEGEWRAARLRDNVDEIWRNIRDPNLTMVGPFCHFKTEEQLRGWTARAKYATAKIEQERRLVKMWVARERNRIEEEKNRARKEHARTSNIRARVAAYCQGREPDDQTFVIATAYHLLCSSVASGEIIVPENTNVQAAMDLLKEYLCDNLPVLPDKSP